MTNKDQFLTLVSPANNETLEGMRFREENKIWLKESKRIAIKVLKALKQKGLTQKELANDMNVSPQYVNKLIKGNENFTLETLIKLQSLLDIPLLASYHESKNTSSHSIKIYSYEGTYENRCSEYNSSIKPAVG